MRKFVWVTLLLACSSGDQSSLKVDSRPLGGFGVEDATESTAGTLATPAGVAGAVAALRRSSSSGVFEECPAVLVARRVLVTSQGCNTLQRPGPTGGGGVSVVFPQAGGYEVAASRHWNLGTHGALAVVHLNEDVPEEIVENLVPIFSDDVEAAFSMGRLSDPILVGYGPSCEEDCSDDGIRRVGPLGVPLTFTPEGNPVAHFDPSVGVVPFYVGDAGAPLLAWDDWSQRYVLVGIPKDRTPPTTGTLEWDILGKGSFDRWRLIARTWVEPYGAIRVLEGDEAPGNDWRPLIGLDRDGDRVFDEADNCPPSRCDDRGIELWECADPTQVDSSGLGEGDRCGGLSAPVPQICKTTSTLPLNPFLGEPLTTTWWAEGRNSNREAEVVAGVKEKKDLCDPVPQLRFTEAGLSITNPIGYEFPFLTPSKGVATFSAQPILGAGSWQPLLVERPEFAFCECWEGERLECAWETGCDPLRVKIGMQWHRGLSVNKPLLGFKEYVTARSWLDPQEFSWSWLSDATAGRIPAELQEGTYRARGLFASTVQGETWTSRRDSEFEGGLRSVLALRELWETEPETPNPVVWTIPFEERKNEPDCGDYEYWEILRDPILRERCIGAVYPQAQSLQPDSPLDFISVAPSGVLLTFSGERLLAVRDGWWHMDITEFSSAAAREALRSKLSYVSPVEPHAALHAHGVEGSLIGMALEGVGVHRFTFLGGLDVESLGIDLGVTWDHRVAFSALEDGLYVAGGDAQGIIRRVDLRAGTVDELMPSTWAPTSRVLAVAYDPGIATLFVLDVENQTARLVAHRLAEQKSDILWSLPFQDLYLFVSLDVAENRELVLTVGTLQGFTAWRLDPATGDFLSRLDRAGKAIRLPSMGLNHLYMPFEDLEGRLRQQSLAPWFFGEGEPCSSL